MQATTRLLPVNRGGTTRAVNLSFIHETPIPHLDQPKTTLVNTSKTCPPFTMSRRPTVSTAPTLWSRLRPDQASLNRARTLTTTGFITTRRSLTELSLVCPYPSFIIRRLETGAYMGRPLTRSSRGLPSLLLPTRSWRTPA
jgi:hypothetical protein